MTASELVLLLWAALVFWVLGQIWLVRIVVYPLFARVGEMDYVRYHRFYSRRKGVGQRHGNEVKSGFARKK